MIIALIARSMVFLLQATGLKGSMEAILDEADMDGDGRISLPEFKNLLRQASLGSRNNNDHDVHTQHQRRRVQEAHEARIIS
jgi:calcium-dependent protein kinase